MESGGVLAQSPSLVIQICNEELAEVVFVYKLAKFLA